MIILDIESKPDQKLIDICKANIKAPKNYKDQDKIDQYIAMKVAELQKTMATDPDYTDIVCVGVKTLGGEAKIYEAKDLPQILGNEQVIIGFNIKAFDIPVIIKYGIRNGLDLPYQELRGMMKRWNSDGSIDLMEIISDGKDWKSLDEYAQIYLGAKKEPIDFTTASVEEIKSHCLIDLELTEQLYNKFKVIL